MQSASELAELHIERLGLVAVEGGADGVISMDFSEDSRFLRFATSHVVAESIEGATAQPETSGDAGAGAAAEEEEKEEDQGEVKAPVQRYTQMNISRLATLELVTSSDSSSASDMMDVASALWAGEDCSHDSLLSAPHAGRSGWLPRGDIASPACAVACPGAVAMGVRVRVDLGSSSSGVVDAAEAGLRLFRRPCASPLKAASLKVPQHGQSLRIKGLAYSAPTSALISVLSSASAVWGVDGSVSDNSGDGAIFVWQFEDQRSFDESGAPKPLNVERSSP